jgi:hypothetical protein
MSEDSRMAIFDAAAFALAFFDAAIERPKEPPNISSAK